MRVAILGTLGVLLTVLAYVGRHDFRAQSIPLDSLYVLGTQGEEMANYTVDLQEGSGVRIWWNMNTVSTRDGYAIYCGLRRNGAGYETVPPQDDRTERPMVSTTYDFSCRSCKTGTHSSCIGQANTDYITTYERTFSVRVPGSPAPAPSSRSTVASQSFLVEGTQGEQPLGTTLTLRAGSDVRLAWNISPETNSVYYYSIYCGLKRDNGTMEQVPLSHNMTESIDRQRSYELTCRNCRNWKDYDGYVDPIVPWDSCWSASNIDFRETFKKQYVAQRISVCGDGILGSSETCDDANVAGGDGCSASCQTEPSYRCTGTTCVSIACNDGIDNDGDGMIDAQENGQPHTHLFGSEEEIRALLNGISALITPDPLREKEFDCELPVVGSKWIRTSGPDIKEPYFSYDNSADKFCKKFRYDGAVNATCLQELCSPEESAAGQRLGRWNGEQMIRESCYPLGVLSWAHYQYYNSITCIIRTDCNDGEDNDYDNLKDMKDPDCTNPNDTSELRADNGCTSPTDPSEGGCGDGIKEPAEQCDDGNLKPGDGCGATCLLERGMTPTTVAASVGTSSAPSSSRSSLTSRSSETVTAPTPLAPLLQPASSTQPNRCGDGVRGNAEECDDGNRQNGDGCSATCLYEGLPPPRSSVRSVAFAVSSAKPAPPVPAAQPPKPAVVSSVRQSAAPIPAAQTPTISSAAAVISRPSVLSSAKQSVAWVAPIPVIVSSAAGTPLPSAPFATCGNGKLEEREQCDRGPLNALTPNADCRPDCTFGRCGDGILDPLTEECDDGNRFEGDGCSLRCLRDIRPSVSSVQATIPVLTLPALPPLSSASSLTITVSSAADENQNPVAGWPAPAVPDVAVRPAAPPAMPQEFGLPSAEPPFPEPQTSSFAAEQAMPSPEMPFASSFAPEPTPLQQDGFFLWHLPVLRPDIFPTLRVAEEALLFVQHNICTSSPAEVVPYLPYFRCAPVQSGFKGSLTGTSAGSASLGAIAGLLVTGVAWVRMRRKRPTRKP